MDPVSSFDKDKARFVSDLVMGMLSVTAQKLGLEATYDRGRYTPNSFTMSISFKVVGEGGMPAEFPSLCRRVGLPPDVWGRSFTASNNRRMVTFKICGVKPSNRKYKVLANAPDGTCYRFTVATVLKGLLPD